MNTSSLPLYSSQLLRQFIVDVLTHFEVTSNDAELAADVLTTSDLRGVDSHGIARLPNYVKWLHGEFVNPQPEVRLVRETPCTGLVDGDGGLGIIVGPRANKIAIEKASNLGMSFISVFNSNHFGIAGYYALEAAKRDLIGMTMSNATAQVAPAQSVQPMLGTNPMAVAIPANKERPFVLDMATSAVAYGKIEIAGRVGKEIPLGWAIDNRTGEPIHDPHQVNGKTYAMLPLGSTKELSVHKGYGLSSIVDILSGVLSGAMWGPFCPHFTYPEWTREKTEGRGLGHVFAAMKIEAVADTETFKSEMDSWIKVFRESTTAEGFDEVLVPGDPEWRAFDKRSEEGIPLVPKVVEGLKKISKDTGIAFE